MSIPARSTTTAPSPSLLSCPVPLKLCCLLSLSLVRHTWCTSYLASPWSTFFASCSSLFTTIFLASSIYSSTSSTLFIKLGIVTDEASTLCIPLVSTVSIIFHSPLMVVAAATPLVVVAPSSESVKITSFCVDATVYSDFPFTPILFVVSSTKVGSSVGYTPLTLIKTTSSFAAAKFASNSTTAVL